MPVKKDLPFSPKYFFITLAPHKTIPVNLLLGQMLEKISTSLFWNSGFIKSNLTNPLERNLWKIKVHKSLWKMKGQKWENSGKQQSAVDQMIISRFKKIVLIMGKT